MIGICGKLPELRGRKEKGGGKGAGSSVSTRTF